MKSRFRLSRWGIGVCTVLAFALSAAMPSVAFADDDEGVNAGDIAGWEYTNAPPATHFAILTQLQGTKNQFTGAPSEEMLLGVATGIGEFAPIPEFSAFGEISYRYIAGGETQSTGWLDPIIGVKVAPINTSGFVMSAMLFGNIPLSANKVTIRDYEATNFGIAVSWAPVDLFAFNASFDFGRIWKLELENEESVKAIEFNYKLEFVVTPPALFTARIGLKGVYRDQGIDKSMMQFYVEVNALRLLFVRVAFPIDIDQGVQGVHQGFETGEWLVTVGIWFPLL